MPETIPGGAYLLPDKKTWVNANGTKIAAPRADSVYVRPEEPEALTGEQVTPGAGLVDEFGAPEDSISEGQPLKARKSTKKS